MAKSTTLKELDIVFITYNKEDDLYGEQHSTHLYGNNISDDEVKEILIRTIPGIDLTSIVIER